MYEYNVIVQTNEVARGERVATVIFLSDGRDNAYYYYAHMWWGSGRRV